MSNVSNEEFVQFSRYLSLWYMGKRRISDVKGGIMSKLNLRVIAKIFYDQELEYDENDAMNDVASSGHSLTFSEAINAVLSNLATLFGMPKWLLGSSGSWCLIAEIFLIQRIGKAPFESHNKAYRGYHEWGQYMHEKPDSVQSRLEVATRKDEPCFLSK